jgi:hypothetical protein
MALNTINTINPLTIVSKVYEVVEKKVAHISNPVHRTTTRVTHTTVSSSVTYLVTHYVSSNSVLTSAGSAVLYVTLSSKGVTESNVSSSGEVYSSSSCGLVYEINFPESGVTRSVNEQTNARIAGKTRTSHRATERGLAENGVPVYQLNHSSTAMHSTAGVKGVVSAAVKKSASEAMLYTATLSVKSKV